MAARASNPLLDLEARPVIAHRGASAAAPENTLAAFELAAGQGADAFELDVRLSVDGAPVVIHDATLERTTDGTGPVRAQALVDLRLLDAGAGFSPDGGATFPYRGQGLRLPTLGEVLWAFPRMPILVEVKEPEAQEAVRRVLVQEGAVERCVVASELQEALEAFRDPPFARAASSSEIAQLYRGVLLRRRAAAPPYQLLSVPLRYRGLPVPTRRFVAAARELGCPVHVWTVNEPATARRLWARGVAGMVTNVPEAMLKARPLPPLPLDR
ncbi:MAG: glycerophosphodiester phosphodiesterase [Gemmatimonadales bacterium]|nr:glycerophosphodiester phosphodiesterase [Gemmatimonadales bacterium]MBA3553246.1 glycerophosphodiester phosphodiesterase [Gemmatimonadales bacterium]